LADFKASLSDAAPAPDLAPTLAAMWWAAKGDWHKAHSIAQDEETSDGSWVHAYLHRVEGDLGNAGYWYRKAGKPAASGPIEAEWDQIVQSLIGNSRV
jgi:hypothetical protein